MNWEKVYRIIFWVGAFISPPPLPPPYKKNRSKEFSGNVMNKKKVYMILMIIFWALPFLYWILWIIIPRAEFSFFFIPAIIFTLLYIKNRSKKLSRTQKVILNVILWTVIGIVAVFIIFIILMILAFSG